MKPQDESPPTDHVRSWPLGDLLSYLLIVGVVTAGLLAFSDRDGYEGDDLSFHSALYQLSDAKRGEIELYRYAWQPLAYEASAWVYLAFDSPDPVFMMSPVCCAIAISVLLLGMHRYARVIHSPWAHVAILVLLPELFFDGLYYNTTALALPFAALAVFFLLGFRNTQGTWRVILIGITLTLATLIRFDFLLLFPLTLCLMWIERRSPWSVVGFGCGAVAIVLLAVFSGTVKPLELIDTLRTHHSEVNLGIGAAKFVWRWQDNVKTIAATMHPAAWVITLCGLPVLAREFSVRQGVRALVLTAVAVLPLLYPLTAFTSVKYAIPLLLLLPFAILGILGTVNVRWPILTANRLSWGLVAIACFAFFVSADPTGKPPFLRFTTTEPKIISTHDGQRSLGAYGIMLMKPGRNDAGDPEWVAASRLFNAIQQNGGADLWFVGWDSSYGYSRVGWRYLRMLLARNGHRGRVIAPHTVQYEVGNHRVTFTVPSPSETKLAGRIAPGAIRIDLSGEINDDDELIRLVDQALSSGRRKRQSPGTALELD